MGRLGSILSVVLLGGAMGCGGATSLRLEVSEGPGVPSPQTIRLSLYANGPLSGGPWLEPLGAVGKTLPGAIVVGPLDAALPDFRVQLDGLDALGAITSQAADRITLESGRQMTHAFVLGPPLDDDGDGVANAIDDCPGVPDPKQDCRPSDLGGAPADLAATPFDLGPDGGALPCPVNAIFCDDFESGGTSNWDSKKVASLFNLLVDGTRVFRGKYALDVRRTPLGGVDFGLASANGGAFVEKDPKPRPALYAREYVYFNTAPDAYQTVLDLQSLSNDFEVGVAPNGRWTILQDNRTSPDHLSMLAAPTAQWTCIELGVDATSGTISLYADGREIVSYQATIPDNPDTLLAGTVNAYSGTAARVFIDDVALAPARIGCE